MEYELINALIDGLGWPQFVSLVGLIGVFFVILHALYIRVRYQPAIDRAVMGSQYFDMWVFFAFNKLLMYGHYCLFPKRARRAGVHEIFENLPRVQRLNLIVFWGFFIVCCFLFFGGALLDYCLK